MYLIEMSNKKYLSKKISESVQYSTHSKITHPVEKKNGLYFGRLDPNSCLETMNYVDRLGFM